MGKPFWRSVEYFFTGHYPGDDGNNTIVAIGFGGEIHAYGGDDHVTVGSIGATVYTGSGDDTVVGGSAYLKIEDTTGDLTVKGAAGCVEIDKSGDGDISFSGAAGGVVIDSTANHGDVEFNGAAAYNSLTRKGLTGSVIFKGAGGYNGIWHETNQGTLQFVGAGAGNNLDRTWFNNYEGSRGPVLFKGAGGSNSISSRVEEGNIIFEGAGADNHIVRKGKIGDISLFGAGASNRMERVCQAEDVYSETKGDLRFEGAGGYNSLYSEVATGDIHFSGAGAFNKITRKGLGKDLKGEGLANANADEIVLTSAMMSGFWVNKPQQVQGIKSTREPNTYLFAVDSGTYTKINKVQLRNDPQTGQLKYYSTAWYKNGNHLNNIANKDISVNGGFYSADLDGAISLTDLAIEHRQAVTVHAVEKDLIEYKWVTYADGALIDAADITLSDAKMGGYAISRDGSKVDVKAVKSNRYKNAYVYGKVHGQYTKIVLVELANDPETGELKYRAKSWFKTGDHTSDLANEEFSGANGYTEIGGGGYSLSDLQYSVKAVRSISERVVDINEYTEQALIKAASGEGDSSGDITFNGAGAGNVILSNVTRGNVDFVGGGGENVIVHSSRYGNTDFEGAGIANIIVKSGQIGDLTFRGAGATNVLVHQGKQGKMDVYAAAAANVLVRVGDGEYLARLLAIGNISVHKGNGRSQVTMLGGYNTHTQIGNGNGLWLAAGGFNVMTQVGKGDVASVLAGGANVLTKIGDGDLTSGMIGGGNIITHISSDSEFSDTTAVALGGANILTKKGKGNTLAVMGGAANVLTHVGDGATTGVMVGGANILTKVGNGDTTGVMLGLGNVLTHVGDGQTLGVMGAAGNIFTKVGDGTAIAAMVGAGNIFTHVGEGDAWALMGAVGNIFTKVGDGNALALMVGKGNIFTHIGDGMSVALMLAKANIATKVGNGTTLAAMVGAANIFTHVGNGTTFAAMVGKGNILTKVGNELTAGLMVGTANIFTHVGDGTSIGLFAGKANIMTKVGDGTTLAAMFGKANIMTHVGGGLTGVLALGEANIVTKVGDDFMGVVAASKLNVVTHDGDGTTAAVLGGQGNILTKVGDGTTVGLLVSKVGNVMTHIGDGMTLGFAKGNANIITKVGDGLGINAAWGEGNVLTHVGDGDRYTFAKGKANILTKVGDGQEVAVVHGEANIITHVGDGDDYTGAWGKANVITKVGDGRNVVLAKGEANIVTQVGDGDSFNALWSKGNIVTKVGDGMQVTAAKGKANITTTVGDGLSVTAAYGDANINTKVGDGVSVNVAWGKLNVNTKVGDGLNVAVMKGRANVNIHVGDGLGINASYARNNIAVKVGNGDFYSLAVASSNTKSNKLSSLFENIKQTVLGVGGSQAINYLVHGDEASSSGSRRGRGAIATPEVAKLNGFRMDKVEGIGTELKSSLTAGVTDVKTPDLTQAKAAFDVTESSDGEAKTRAVKRDASQDTAKDNALADKQAAEANRAVLEQEKAKQLGKVAGTQAQLESTDQAALANNGQAQRDAVTEESEAVTAELTAMAQGLDALDNHAGYQGESGDNWREHFAGGVLDDVQEQLDQSKAKTGEHLAKSQQQIANSQQDVKDSVAKSESGVAKGEQNRVGAEQDIVQAKANAEQRRSEAGSYEARANRAEGAADKAARDARARGEEDTRAAKNKTSQAQDDAEGAKLDKDHRPDRQKASGSGLSGKQYSNDRSNEADYEGNGRYASEQVSHVDADSAAAADGRYSAGLSDEELAALEGANQAVNRLQINAGVRAKNTGESITAMFTSNNVGSQVVQGDQSNTRKIRIVERVSEVYFNHVAGGKELESSSFTFHQSGDFLNKLTKLIPEIGDVLITNGDHAESKEFLDGVCFALSARYLMEERVHGLGGGKQYMQWLKDSVDAYNSNKRSDKSDIASVENRILGHYRRQYLGAAIQDLLSLQGSQVKHDNQAYSAVLKANGLTGERIDHATSPLGDGYEDYMDSLQNLDRSLYSSFMSPVHAMAVVVHVNENEGEIQRVWSFYDPNLGTKSFSTYSDFRSFMDRFFKNPLTSHVYQMDEHYKKDQSFMVQYNKFEDGEITAYNGTWKRVRDGEQGYLLRALQDQGKVFKFNKQLSGKVVGFDSGQISFELTTKAGKSFVVEVEAEQFAEAAKLVQVNAKQLIANPSSKTVYLHRRDSEYLAISGLDNGEHGNDEGASLERPLQKKYRSRDLVLEPIKQAESVELGMPEADQEVLADIADRKNVIIGVRPVDEKSKSLIASKMYSSKGLFVKAKSSDWGPMSGFIPVDQSFAKASARRDLEKFNDYATQSIQSGHAVSVDLYLNKSRVDDLISKYRSLIPLALNTASGMYHTAAFNGEQVVDFYLNKVTVDDKELWQVHCMKDGELTPFKVIGDPVSRQPMTADYDLLTVMHAYGDLGPKDKVKQPLTWEQWKESVTYEDLAPRYKDLYDNEAHYNINDGASLGIVSDRLRELKDEINTGLGRTNGLEMVHHGADDANPYAVIADNFPATFFVPKNFFEEDGLGEGKGSIQTYFNVNEQGAVIIRNPQEFSDFQQVAINASYRATLNDKWNEGLDNPLFTKKRKLSHDFLDARDEVERKLNGGDNNLLEGLGGRKGGNVVHTIDTLQPSEILDQVIRDLNKSSTVMSETNFYDPKKFESNSARVKAEWQQTLTIINNIRDRYFPHDMASYFETLKSYRVGNCGDRALYAAHLIMDKYNFQGEVELMKLKGSGDHVFVRIGGTSDSAKIIDPWTGQHFPYSQIKHFLYNPRKKKVQVHRSFNELKTLFQDLHHSELSSVNQPNNRDVMSWDRVAVTPRVDGGESRFDGQIIIQTENDPVAAQAAANLAGKHPESSVIVQLDADGYYRVVYGEPSQLSGKLRWQVVGHGRDESESKNTRLSGYSADELALNLARFNRYFNHSEGIVGKPEHISIVGCSLVSDDLQEGFARRFISEIDSQGIRSDVSARSAEVAVNSSGRKLIRSDSGEWTHKFAESKVLLSWSEQGVIEKRHEAIRNGIAEGDVDLARVGQSDSDTPARGAIGDNNEIFTAPEKRRNTMETSSGGSDSQLSYSGNIQVNVGDGEFTAVNWGTSNVGIKVGTGGFKSLAFGDNNVMVHVGNGDSKHSFDIAGYQALEGAQMFIGTRNVSFNMGRSNDLIVMMDKSIPTPPLVNPFDGASRISGVLQGIARSGEGQDWLAAQEQQWTLSGAKKFVKDMSGLDQSSSVDYTSLVELDSQHERSSRGLKHDAEATLNKQYNKWLSGKGNKNTANLSRADKFRQANEKLAFNFAVGGQGADIQVTTGNWNFMFGDNIQSILDTNLGSLFGLMTQQFSASGQAKTTFTYSPQDLPRQLKNKLLGKLAGVGADTTLGDIFGVDYTASGHIVSRNGEPVDGMAILKEMLEVIGEFSGDQLQAFTDPTKLLDSLKSGIDMGADGIKSFAESHGLKEKAPEEEEDKSSVSVNGEHVGAAEQVGSAGSAKPERAFGFNALNLPNLFATIFSADKQAEMKSLVENLKDNLTADLLNMKAQTFDFLRNSGHLQGDGDINVSLGNYNFNWGGDGKDLGAYLGDNNNFWGGRGDDVYYATGTSNIFTGGEGNDMGVLMGRENMMFGGDGNDTAVVAGRINHVFMGAGDDQSFVFGEGGEINTGSGRDYVVTSGNFNRVDTGEDQDYSVTIGNNNQVELGGGNDFTNVFGNYNRVNGSAGNDVIKLMGYHAVLNGGEGNDHLIAAAISKFSQFDGGQGRDLMVLGGYQNTFKGGEDVDSFIVSGNVIDNLVEDIRSEDNIVFNGVDWQNLWFERSGYDLKLSVLREPEAETDQAKFESVGSVTFADYFNGNRAELVIGMGEKDAAGEREYTALSNNAVDALVQAMSSFAPQAGDNGFIDNLDSKAQVAVTTAWADVTRGRAAVA